MNWANLLTVLRVALVPAFAWFAWPAGEDKAVAMLIFFVASITDFLDGYIARKTRTITRLGQFLDPLADKVLVGAALFVLVVRRDFPLWAAVVIAVREIAVSWMRSTAAKKGISLPASLSGKAKTAVQVPMVLAWLLPRRGTTALVQDLFMYLAIALTLVSGALFIARHRRLVSPKGQA